MTGGDYGETFTWLLVLVLVDQSHQPSQGLQVVDLSEVMVHVSWTTSHTALYLLYQLVKVFNPGGTTHLSGNA